MRHTTESRISQPYYTTSLQFVNALNSEDEELVASVHNSGGDDERSRSSTHITNEESQEPHFN